MQVLKLTIFRLSKLERRQQRTTARTNVRVHGATKAGGFSLAN